MSERLNTLTWKRIVELIIISILIGNLNAFAAPRMQNDSESRIAEAVSLFQNNQIQKAVAIFREVGDPAVPIILGLWQTEAGSIPAIQMMLLDSIASAKGEHSDAALLKFLSDKSPYIRGFAAVNVGGRKLKSAVPQLINLLNDKEAYMSWLVWHPNGYDKEPLYTNVPVPVRDTAIDALQLITGKVLTKGKSREKQVEAWQQWWRKQQGSK